MKTNTPVPRKSSPSGKLPQIIDYIIGRLIIITLVFIWCRFYLPALWQAVAFTALITLAVIAVFDILLVRTPQAKQKNHQQKEIAALYDRLIYTGKEQFMAELNNIIGSRHQTALKDGAIIITESGKIKSAICAYLSPSKLAPHDAADIIHRLAPLNAPSLIIITCGYLPSAQGYTARLSLPKVTLLDHEDLYAILQNYGQELSLPAPKLRPPAAAKPPLRTLAQSVFERRRVKGYIFASITMVIASFFIRFSLYYRVFATVFLLMALLSLKNPLRPQQKTLTDFEGL